MATGKNPISYQEIFDFQDKGVINSLIADIKDLDANYSAFSKSITKLNKAMRDSHIRMVNDMIAASQRLNIAREADRASLNELAVATEQLRQRQKTQQETADTAAKVQKAAADSINGLKNRLKELAEEYNNLSASDAEQVKRMKEITIESQKLQAEQKQLSDSLKGTKRETDYAVGSYKKLEQETKALKAQLANLPNGFNTTSKEVKQLTNQISANETKLKDFNKIMAQGAQSNKVGQDSLVAIRKEIKVLTLEYGTLSKATINEAVRMDEITDKLQILKREEKALTDALKERVKETKYAADSVLGLQQSIEELEKEYKTLSRSSATEETRMVEIIQAIQKLKAEHKELNDALKLAKQQNEHVAGSYNELDAETRKLMTDLKELPDAWGKNRKQAEEMAKQIYKNNQALKDFDAAMNIHTRNVGNYQSALQALGLTQEQLTQGAANAVTDIKGFALGMAAAFTGFEGLQEFGNKVAETNIEIADTLSDVQRTAGLTGKEADRLTESLKKIDTRTTLKGLLDLTVIGGQLGVEKDQLAGFAKAIDQLSVSLAGEISGGAEEVASSLGKINGVFKVQEKEGVNVEQSMLKTGSAILKLGQVGQATGGFLTDFTQRMGGVAENAGVSLPKILAYGATLEEMGMSAEVSGSAMGDLIGMLAKSPEAFYQVAKLGDATLTLKEFSDQINNDTSLALDKFFTGLNAGGKDQITFNQLLDELKIRGTRSASVVTTLAKNQELLQLRVKQSSEAFKDGTLATEQFQVKNTNLAAAMEKLANVITNTFIDSAFSRELASWINGMVDGKRKGDALTDTFKQQKAILDSYQQDLPPLLDIYDRLTGKAKAMGGVNKLTAEEQEKLNTTMQAIANIMPDAIEQVDKYGKIVSIARDKIGEMTEKQREYLRVVNKDAAANLEKENKQRERAIQILQQEIATGKTLKSASAGTGGATTYYVKTDKIAAQEEIARISGEMAQAVKKLKDDLMQPLTQEQQKLYEDYFNTAKKVKDTAKGTSEEVKATDEEIASVMGNLSTNSKKARTEFEQLQKTVKSLQNQAKSEALNGGVTKATLDQLKDAKARLDAAKSSLGALGGEGGRVKTAFEKMEDQAEKLENTLKSQAMAGKVSTDTMKQFTAASEKVREAQEAGELAIQKAIAPYNALGTQIQQLNQKLENQVAKGEDVTATINSLTVSNQVYLQVQNEIKVAIAATVGPLEVLNTKLELCRQRLEKQAMAGKISADTLSEYAKLSKESRDANDLLQLSILQVTDPLAALSMQADIFKRILVEQALAGDISTESIEKYREAIINLDKAQTKLNEATDFDPKDPQKKIRKIDTKIAENEQGANAVGARAEAGDRGALEQLREFEAQRLALTLERLDQEQSAYKKGSREYEQIETEKTRIKKEQEKARYDISKETAERTAEIVAQGLQLMEVGVNGFFDLQKAKNDNALADLQDKKEKELALVGNNTAARQKIEDKYNQKQKEIKRKQAQQEKAQALFQVAIQTAIGVAKAVAESPLTFGLPWSAFVLAQGVIQAALIAARPLPQYYKGRKGGPAEFAILGERGPEAVKGTDGNVRITPGGAHVGWLNKGDTVFTADSAETQAWSKLLSGTGSTKAMNTHGMAANDILQAMGKHETAVMVKAMQQAGNSMSVRKMRDAFAQALDSQPRQEVHFDEMGFRMYTRKRHTTVENLNARNSMFGQG